MFGIAMRNKCTLLVLRINQCFILLMTIQDTREDEQARTITIKATAVSLFFSLEEELIRDVVLTQLRGSDAERAVFTCSFVFGVNCA